jgi:hypothetical protein
MKGERVPADGEWYGECSWRAARGTGAIEDYGNTACVVPVTPDATDYVEGWVCLRRGCGRDATVLTLYSHSTRAYPYCDKHRPRLWYKVGALL